MRDKIFVEPALQIITVEPARQWPTLIVLKARRRNAEIQATALHPEVHGSVTQNLAVRLLLSQSKDLRIELSLARVTDDHRVRGFFRAVAFGALKQLPQKRLTGGGSNRHRTKTNQTS